MTISLKRLKLIQNFSFKNPGAKFMLSPPLPPKSKMHLEATIIFFLPITDNYLIPDYPERAATDNHKWLCFMSIKIQN